MAREDHMVTSTHPRSPGELLGQAKADLRKVADTIDGLCLHMDSTETIEAKRAIHAALIALGSLGDLLCEASPASRRTPAIIPRNEDENRGSVTRFRVSSPGSPSISIIYNDLLAPVKGASKVGPEDQAACGEQKPSDLMVLDLESSSR